MFFPLSKDTLGFGLGSVDSRPFARSCRIKPAARNHSQWIHRYRDHVPLPFQDALRTGNSPHPWHPVAGRGAGQSSQAVQWLSFDLWWLVVSLQALHEWINPRDTLRSCMIPISWT
jgi:hypothetical protein